MDSSAIWKETAEVVSMIFGTTRDARDAVLLGLPMMHIEVVVSVVESDASAGQRPVVEGCGG